METVENIETVENMINLTSGTVLLKSNIVKWACLNDPIKK